MHVHIGGIVVILLVALILFFGMIRPKTQDTDLQNQAAASAVSGGGTEADNKKTAADLVKEKKNTKQIQADWLVYQKKYMPDWKWENNLLAAYYLTNKVNDIPAQFGHWITDWYDAQKRDGITRAPGVVFPIPPLATDPNGIAALTSVTFPTAKSPWKVSLICQTFDDAMAHLRRFNSMVGHGMPVVDGVTLSGHSPELMLNYNLALYIIPIQPPPPADTRIGVSTGGNAGGMGGMGGMSPMGGSGGGMPGGAKGGK
jgi:hypothetical protein